MARELGFLTAERYAQLACHLDRALDLEERSSRNVEEPSELPSPLPPAPLGDVERYAVAGSHELLGERMSLATGEPAGGLGAFDGECLGELPGSEVSKRGHAILMSRTQSGW